MPKAAQPAPPVVTPPSKGVVASQGRRQHPGKQRSAEPRRKPKSIDSVEQALGLLSKRRLYAISYASCVSSWKTPARLLLRRGLAPALQRVIEVAMLHARQCNRVTVTEADISTAARSEINLQILSDGMPKIDCRQQQKVLRLIDDPSRNKHKKQQQHDEKGDKKKNKHKAAASSSSHKSERR